MEHQGQKLLRLIKSKGFNLQEVADRIPKTRVSVERDVKSANLSRKVVGRYALLLDFDLESFFNNSTTVSSKMDNKTEVELLRELVTEQRKRLDLQDRVINFFPNAAQMI